jgi:DNA replication protein DnaC
MSWSGEQVSAATTAGESRDLSRCPFDVCDGSGLVFDEETNTAYDCRCRRQIIALRKARSLSAVIPRRYRDAAFDRYPVTEMEQHVVSATRRFATNIDKHLDAGRGLWFMGPVGTGKTTLAMLVSKAALEMLDRLAAVDLLHIDDVGAERTTDWVLEELYSIVNARYEEQRSMVITTNITDRDALCEQITARTVSRLTEMCDELPLDGDDRRMEFRSE